MPKPTKYKPSYCKKIIQFFDVEPYEEREIPHYDKSGKKVDGEKVVVWNDIRLIPNRLPTLRKFAKVIGVNYTTVYAWIKKHPKFKDAFEEAQAIRKEFLIDNALAGLYPPATFKFVAVNLTDMKDTSEVVGDLHIFINEKLHGSKN